MASSSHVDLSESHQPVMLRVTLPFLIISYVAVLARIYAKRFVKLPLAADDCMILVALVFTTGTFATAQLQVLFGEGKHTVLASQEQVKHFYQAIISISVLYACAITSVKLSILLFFQRLFPVQRFTVKVRITGAVCLIWWIAVIAIQIFSCKPIHAFWDRSVPSTCVDRKLFYVGVAVPNIITDIIILALPVRMIWGLQTSPGQKIGLSLTFLTGGLYVFPYPLSMLASSILSFMSPRVIVASSYRLGILLKKGQTDPLWDDIEVSIWTSVEPSVAVVSACLPTLRPLLRLTSPILHRLGLSRSQGSRKRHGYDIQLGSGGAAAQSAKFSDRSDWVNDLTLHQPANAGQGHTATAAGNTIEDPERDEMLLPGINVQHEVSVVRTEV